MSIITWQTDEAGELVAIANGRVATWAPQPGSQQAFMECPVFETLYTGTRGPGKTDALLMDFAQHVGQGFGADWRGVLFRRTYPELGDVMAKSKKWFYRIWPDAHYNEAKSTWHWPTGETLLFRQFAKHSDYYAYHGHAYPWIAWEELTTWPDDVGYKLMFSCCRSTVGGMPRKVRSTTNPYGVGHNWVKMRFRLPIPRGVMTGPVIRDSVNDEGDLEPPRVAIHGRLEENQILLRADPGYSTRILAAARNSNERKAWKYGDWDIVAGGMFDDLWRKDIHILPHIPFKLIPKQWRVDRSYDHGQSAPFSYGVWAESNGEPFKHKGYVIGPVRGDLVRIAEWYGWTGQPNEGLRMDHMDIAEGIVDREVDWRIRSRIKPGPADASIFDDPNRTNKSIGIEMGRKGARFLAADKSPGSRKQGWGLIRNRLEKSVPINGYREHPGLFVTENCTQFLRTFPVLPRSDKDLDDVDSESEDHIGDETRYRVRNKVSQIRQKDI